MKKSGSGSIDTGQVRWPKANAQSYSMAFGAYQVDFGLLVQRSAWKHKRKVELLRYSSLGGKTATECGSRASETAEHGE